MNIKGFKRMLFGEKMPDKDDPAVQGTLRARGAGRAQIRQGDTHRPSGGQGAGLCQRAPDVVSGHRLYIRHRSFRMERLPLGNCVQA